MYYLQLTKTSMLFVLDAETGEPLNEVEERPVPPSSVRGFKVYITV